MRTAPILSALALSTSLASADLTFFEPDLGDFSSDRFAPTFLDFELGTMTVINEVVNASNPNIGDRDYYTFTLNEGEYIDRITIVDAFNPAGGPDTTCFVGMAFDSIFDFDPDAQSGPGLVGHAFSNSFFLGNNIVPDLSNGLDQLGPGDYSLWIQQTGTDVTRIQIEYHVVPAPASAAILGIGLLATTRRRR